MAGKPPNLDQTTDWTVFRNHDGNYSAFRRINGKVRFCHLGPSLDRSEAKLIAATERHSRLEGGEAA
jgi:hypothetical protein